MEEYEVKEYVRYKMVCIQAERSLIMMEPVLNQSFEDEFEIPPGCPSLRAAVPGTFLMNSDPKNN